MKIAVYHDFESGENKTRMRDDCLLHFLCGVDSASLKFDNFDLLQLICSVMYDLGVTLHVCLGISIDQQLMTFGKWQLLRLHLYS